MKTNRKRVIVIAVSMILLLSLAFSQSACALFAERTVSDDVSRYEKLLAKDYHGEGIDTRGVFPASIPDGAAADGFYYEYYNPWDPCFLVYLNLVWEAGGEAGFEAETQRLAALPSSDALTYGASGFGYTAPCAYADDWGIVYALQVPEERRVVYVLQTFTNYFTDIDYTKHVPEKYLPTGFNALPGNERRERFDASQPEAK